MFDHVTLEVSLKPFKQTDLQFIRNVCAEIFEQWKPLLKSCKIVSILLWTSDGSQILDYAGSMDDTFEWDRFIGTSNRELATADERASRVSPHLKKRNYMKNPPVMTYSVLKSIVKCLKSEGKKCLPDTIIRVGETFDIGPEFAISDFKYNRHREVCSGNLLDTFGFIDGTALLKADTRKYAAYPNGIPENTPFGTFLGKQANIYLSDIGFDYFWLSNGLGFSADPWMETGKIYDGNEFRPERLPETKRRVFEFWKNFRGACPDVPIEVRGTNYSVGMDYATDGSPLYDIYNAGFGISGTPNSLWAAIDDDYGLEMMGHMTRICELPCKGFMYRFYLHDPWWWNSPWYDRYDGYASDIYVPMAISRIGADGSTEAASSLYIITIDNSFGEMPDSCVYEPLPHFMKAKKDSPDSPAPLVWVYPMHEYTTTEKSEWLKEMYYADNFIRDAINNGLPLNCVVSTDNFLKNSLSTYKNSILISPVQPSNNVTEKLQEYARSGGKVVVYGSCEKIREIPECDNIKCIDMKSKSTGILDAISEYGYEIRYRQHQPGLRKTPVMAIASHDNGMYFSVHNPDTTTETLMKFPLGAPILSGGEVIINNGFACYRFVRCEHRECRVFVSQNSGVVSLHEDAPVIPEYHRRLRLNGLEDATVCFFPENASASCAEFSTRTESDQTPNFDNRWHLVTDNNGSYYKAEHVSGEVHLLMPFAEQKTEI